MKKIGIFALVLAMTGLLCACNRRNTDTNETTGNTMPTVTTTIPIIEDMVPETSFHPDQDGFIGNTESTTETTSEAAPMPQPRGRLRLR